MLSHSPQFASRFQYLKGRLGILVTFVRELQTLGQDRSFVHDFDDPKSTAPVRKLVRTLCRTSVKALLHRFPTLPISLPFLKKVCRRLRRICTSLQGRRQHRPRLKFVATALVKAAQFLRPRAAWRRNVIQYVIHNIWHFPQIRSTTCYAKSLR